MYCWSAHQDLYIELGVPLQYASDTYQAGLDTIAAACKHHGVVPGMYFIHPDMDPNFFVEKGFTFFTMPWARWALEGIKNGLHGGAVTDNSLPNAKDGKGTERQPCHPAF